MNIDARFGLLTERNRDLIVARCTVPDGVHAVAEDRVVPWGSARFLSRLNAVRDWELRKQRTVQRGIASETKSTGRNLHLTLYLTVL